MLAQIPAGVIRALADHLPAEADVVSAEPVSGGDISDAARLVLGSGQRYFLKWNHSAPKGMFEAEADGLAALGRAAGHDLIVPRALASGEVGDTAWLLMDHIERGTRGAGLERGASWAVRLGRGLAALHRSLADPASPGVKPTSPGAEAAGAEREYGWMRDNFIGRLSQANAPTRGWAAFWRDRRLGPQLRRAADAGTVSGSGLHDLDLLLDRLDEALAGAEAEHPSLLHGDLWGGNVMPTPDGRAAIYDPAVYRGHREVDLAMSELFGFPSDFMPAYREAWPVGPEYDAHRRDVYQLYYLLVHVNLFGAGYVAPSVAAARRVLAVI